MDKKLYINPPLVDRSYDWKNGPQPKTRKELDRFFNSSPIRAVKRQICEMGRRIYQRGYTDGNGGNISVRVGEDLVLCTPTLCLGYGRPGFLSPACASPCRVLYACTWKQGHLHQPHRVCKRRKVRQKQGEKKFWQI